MYLYVFLIVLGSLNGLQGDVLSETESHGEALNEIERKLNVSVQSIIIIVSIIILLHVSVCVCVIIC